MFYIVLTTFSLLGLDVCDEDSAGLMEYRSFCYPCILKAMIGDEDSAGLMEYRSFCYPCILKAMIGWN